MADLPRRREDAKKMQYSSIHGIAASVGDHCLVPSFMSFAPSRELLFRPATNREAKA